MIRILTLCVGLLSGCAAPHTELESDAPPASGAIWSYSEAAARLKASSCEDDTRASAPGEPLSLSIEPVALGPEGDVLDALNGLKLVGGWALSSDHAGFGGLSGLDMMGDDALLAVSDEGAFVHLRLHPETGAPLPSAHLAYMKDADGHHLRGKRRGDAEGLALRDGLAFVSFERDHRIEAFNLGDCGAKARAVLVARLPSDIRPNRGPEALALSEDRLIVGLEEADAGDAPVGWLGSDLPARMDQGRGQLLTGFDQIGDTLFSLHRKYFPGLGNTIAIQAHLIDPDADQAALSRSQTLAHLGPGLAVDNFEGVAALELETGALRLFIISDDNFSHRQRTLLYAFDIQSAG